MSLGIFDIKMSVIRAKIYPKGTQTHQKGVAQEAAEPLYFGKKTILKTIKRLGISDKKDYPIL